MSKVRDISNLSNVIRTDASGNVSFVSGSTTLATINTSGQLSGSSPVLSSSYALNATSASYAVSASNATNAVTASFANAFTVANTLTAQTLVVQTVTSSVIYSSGSNVFGNNIANTQVFTGSVYMNPGGLFVSGSGNVGIGTTTPSASLNIEKSTNSGDYGVFPMAIINNSLATQGDGSTSYNFAAIYTNSGNGVVKMSMQSSYAAGTWEPQGILNVATNHPMVLKTNNTERMRISSTGITTITGNGGSLVQKASTANADLYFEMLNSAGTRRSYMGFGGASSSLFEISNNENGAIDFRTNAAFAMRITSGGNVGIGTTSPNTKLQILGGTITVGSQNTYALGIGNSSGYDLTLGTDSSYSYIQSWTSKPLSINSQGNSVIFPNTSTNVAIGTSTPTAQGLTIFQGGGDRRIMLELNRNNTPGLQSAIQFTVGSSIMVGQIQHEYVASNQNHMSFSLRNPSGTTIVPLWLNNDGNVGIGTTTPTKALTVNGRMSTQAIVSGNLVAGNIYSNISTSPSFIIICNLNNAAGFSLSGKINAASYTCWNISDVYIRKDYSSLSGQAVITGVAKSGCDFSVVDISYAGDRFIALRFTGNPEIDVLWTGYRLNELFASDGTATVLTSGVTVNSTYASY